MKKLIGVLALAATAAAQEDRRDVTRNYETVKVAEGIYAFVAPEPRSGVVNGNSTVIIGDDGVIVVDTGQFPTLARRQIAEIRKLTDKPVRAVINTHWHWDHNLGNAAYREAFPSAAIISTEFTRDFIAKFTPGFLERMANNGDAIVARLKAMAESGKRQDGTALTADQKEELGHLVRDFGYGVPELRKVVLLPPDQTFDKMLTIHLGKRAVEVRWPGRANTAGDAVVWVPDAKVLVAGDLVVHPTPYATSAYPAEWVAALNSLMSLAPAAIVPGHGPVQRDTQYMALIARALQSVVHQVAVAVRDGLALEEAKQKVSLAAIRKDFAGSDAARGRAFDEYFAANVVTNAYKQAKGESTSESPF